MEKQRSRAQYHVGERQLRNSFEEASRRGGNVGAASLQLLETRIDAMVLRAGYARTIGDDGARLRELPEATQIPPLAAGGGVLIPEWSLGDALTAVLAIPLRVLRLDD